MCFVCVAWAAAGSEGSSIFNSTGEWQLFSQVALAFHRLTSTMWEFKSFTSSSTFAIVSVFSIIAILVIILICVFLMTTDVKYLFMCLQYTCIGLFQSGYLSLLFPCIAVFGSSFSYKTLLSLYNLDENLSGMWFSIFFSACNLRILFFSILISKPMLSLKIFKVLAFTFSFMSHLELCFLS